MNRNRADFVRAILGAAAALTAGIAFYIAGSGLPVAALATGISFAFFAGLVAYGRHWSRSRAETDRAGKLNPFYVVIFVLALAGQVTFISHAPPEVPWGFVVAMGIVALADQVVKRG